jgi:hypothetical protein
MLMGVQTTKNYLKKALPIIPKGNIMGLLIPKLRSSGALTLKRPVAAPATKTNTAFLTKPASARGSNR